MARAVRVGATIGGSIGGGILLPLALLGRLAWRSELEVAVVLAVAIATLAAAVLAWHALFPASLVAFGIAFAAGAGWSLLVPYTSDLPFLYWIPAGVGAAFAAIGSLAREGSVSKP